MSLNLYDDSIKTDVVNRLNADNIHEFEVHLKDENIIISNESINTREKKN